ncbi:MULTISPECIES: AraC family transcriptional regulator [Stutzerimonas]|uniref:AraC family transcriptional regulator n=3 Tax=Stutzerimonas TaxID=2901164 RepID=A0A2S4AT35_STUST|nr:MULTISPECIES: AraC family transcriptional regulator [Stutzerimonas]OCX98587.1 MAG: AraC family transcriptional regulator [Pseudomonas sp. K35]TVT69701.1 MAG: AraC family transcriptional regulator [Pseudomonas sp.]AFM33472.1 transcriptional regulator [Stutzerimonas stutzeri CCUG 29243]MCQ2038013.1 AraC family transcriptional regulator [Stutzerimonas kunmingensis]MCQ4261329.1 AraC family transcriptional regulator [Stutzerimonas stutzeri]
MKGNNDWIRRPDEPGPLERLEAYFSGYGYAPHRHDTYAIGCTLAGVHRFNYRKSARYSLPGDTFVVYPDELHDGEAGSEAGFRYRIIYIQPAMLQGPLGGQPLPFINDGISRDPRLRRVVWALLSCLDNPIEELEQQDALFDLAQVMSVVAGKRVNRRRADFRAAELAREYMHHHLDGALSLDELERVSGRDRWNLSRDFRALYGTSPYRYLTLRRLDHVRRLLSNGISVADAALVSGFNDQSHMSRHFKQAYGLTPAHWARLMRLS